MSHHFGIHPWDVERLTYDELAYYYDALRDLGKRENRPSRTKPRRTHGSKGRRR